ncbi:hypothetical protein EDD11_007453 [Mortierella claussenii]|nr:hypothetical protein EDD11_007453 [Mortierella claussenii]
MFAQDCVELIKALGSFDYACANKHLLRISKVHPTVGSICSRIIQCEGLYSSMQFLKPKLFRREDHLYQMYSEIAADVEREAQSYRDTSAALLSSSIEETTEPSRRLGSIKARQGASGYNSPITNMSQVSPPIIHQYITGNNNLANNGSGHSPTSAVDQILNSGNNQSSSTGNNTSLSPTYHQHFYQHGISGYSGREEQSAADHVVLYSIFRELCNLRMCLIRVYRMISLSTVEIVVDSVLPEAEHAEQIYGESSKVSESFQASVLGAGIGLEIRTLKHGLLMERAISAYDIQNSATHLHLARVSLAEWKRISSEQEYADKTYHKPEETSWRLSIFGGLSTSHTSSGSGSGSGIGGGSGTGSAMGDEKNKSLSSAIGKGGKVNLQPNHLLWLGRWIASEKSKMTIYFMNILLEKEQAISGDERSLWANMDPDMHGMTFRKKTGAHSVSFVYEVPQDIRFSTVGFVSAGAPYEPPTGLNSFPCIYSYPPDPPRDHWPNIISIMQGSGSILRQYRSQYFYDRKIGCTYYLARIDQHVSIVIIYLDKHPQPDTGAMDFLQLLAGKLRHTEVLAAMRLE